MYLTPCSGDIAHCLQPKRGESSNEIGSMFGRANRGPLPCVSLGCDGKLLISGNAVRDPKKLEIAKNHKRLEELSFLLATHEQRDSSKCSKRLDGYRSRRGDRASQAQRASETREWQSTAVLSSTTSPSEFDRGGGGHRRLLHPVEKQKVSDHQTGDDRNQQTDGIRHRRQHDCVSHELLHAV